MMAIRRAWLTVGVLLALFAGSAAAAEVSVMYYFSGELGRAGIQKIMHRFSAAQQLKVVETPVGHEEFKNVALQMAAEGQLPDVVSYWAGARTQFLVDGNALAPLDSLWQRRGYGEKIPEPLAAAASKYNGHYYLIPFGYHAVGFFYNPQAFAVAGIERMPVTWDDFLAACAKLKQAGIAPLALGAKNRWPAQFWFDYLLLRSAGPAYRQRLMSGAARYGDPQVSAVMERWAELLRRGYFAAGVSTDDWDDAADRVASGQAGMTLMGTWISGYWASKQVRPTVDYDFFPFPQLDPLQPRTVIGPVDGLVVGANSRNLQNAEKLIDFLFSDLQAQQDWALAQGALSPNLQVPKTIYNPVVRKALAEVEAAEAFLFAYDLATSPPAAERGLSMFAGFLAAPETYPALLRETDLIIGPLLSPATRQP